MSAKRRCPAPRRDRPPRGREDAGRGVGDGTLGFWSAIRDVFPQTRTQRDWVHKTKNVLDSMPKSVHCRAKAAIIREITDAENKKEAEKAVEKITSEKDLLLTFYDCPAEHWRHLRITNPIESTFAPVRARIDITKGAGSRQAGLAIIFKLMEAAEGRRRGLNGSHLSNKVRAGAEFKNRELVEGKEEKVAA